MRECLGAHEFDELKYEFHQFRCGQHADDI